MKTKVCTICHKSRRLSNYSNHKGTFDKLNYVCKPCVNKKSKIWRKKNAQRVKENNRKFRNNIRESELKKKYNLTLQSRQVLLESQNNKCAICSCDINFYTMGKGQFAVDHCHRTNKVRGILCRRCNVCIGMFNDEADTIMKASEYLKRHQ